jgi:hypothetical protein
MQRFLALLLTLVACAYAPAQLGVRPEAPRIACSCCDGEGSCGMPGCLPPPAASSTPSLATPPAQIAQLQVRRLATPARRIGEKFYSAFVPSPAVLAAPRAPLTVTPPAGVPLFKAHCSFLV